MNKFEILIPEMNLENLMQDSVLMRNAKKPTTKDKILDRAAFLLSQITYLMHNNDQGQLNGQVHLYSKILKSYVPDYHKYMKFFEKLDIVLISNSYSTGNKYSKKYSLGPAVEGDKLKVYTLTNKRLIQKIRKQSFDPVARKKYGYLLDMFHKLSVPEEYVPCKSKQNYVVEKQNFYPHQSILVNKLNSNVDENWTFKIGASGRLYNPISNLSKKIRPHLLYDGRYLLVEIDVKNSIPYFSIPLLRRNIIARTPKLRRILIDSNPEVFTESYLDWWLRQDVSLAQDSKNYIAEVLDGKIYDQAAELWNNMMGKQYDRKSVKIPFLSVLNQPPTYLSKKRRILTEEFPNVMKTVNTVNNGFIKTKNGEGENEWKEGDLRCPFAMFTQRAESWFILDVVCKKMHEKHPDCPIFSIHDALYTIPHYADILKKTMIEESERIFGAPLPVHVKDFAGSQDAKAA